MDIKDIAKNVDWKSIVRTAAPTLATVLTGGNPLAGMAVGAISNALLGKPDGSEAEVQAAIMGATPADLAKLREADNNFKLEMERCGIDLAKIEAQDRDSARNMAIKTGDNMPKVLASVYTIGYFAAFGFILKYGINPEIKDVVIALISIMGAAEFAIITYYFGSSASSAKKNDLLAGLRK